MPKMQTALEIRAQIDELVDESNAIDAAAKAADRELDETEQHRWDEINGKSGLLTQLLDSQKRAEQREAEQARLADIRSGRVTPTPDPTAIVAVQRAETPRHFAVPVGRKPKGFESREDAYKSGNWIAAALFGNARAMERCHDWGMPIRAASDLSEGNNLLGGYLVPPQYEQSLINLREEYGVFRKFARTRPMGGDTLQVPRRAAGVTAYCVGENSEITQSDISLGMVEVTAKKWGVLVKMSSELNEDAWMDMAGYLADECAYALEAKLDACGFIGTGTSTYGGIQGVCVRIRDGNHTASMFTATGGEDSFSEILLADLNEMVGMLPQFPGIRPAWHITKPGYYASMVRLEQAAGGATPRHFEEGPYPMFLGYPVVFNNVMSKTLTATAINDVTAVLFGDLSLSSTLGERRGVTMQLSTDRYFEYDQIGIKCTARWGISNHDLGDTSVAGPVIGYEGTT